MFNEAPAHGIMFTIEKWAKRLGMNLDRDPEQIH